MNRIIVDGNKVYEIDEECLKKKEEQRKDEQKSTEHKEK